MTPAVNRLNSSRRPMLDPPGSEVALLMLLPALLACVTQPEYFDAPVDDSGEPVWVDADGDGFAPAGVQVLAELVDCDDSDPTVTPSTERYVPEGWFSRGSPGATREIFISGMCAQVHEVTVAEFVVFMQDMLERGYDNVDASGEPLFDIDDDDDDFEETVVRAEAGFEALPGYELHPATEIWYHSAEAYCAWRGMRLPTEAEWEKAARGVEDARSYPWSGGELDCDHANVNLRDEGTEAEFCNDGTTEVLQHPLGVGPFGLQDSIGNVSEWVSDWWYPDYDPDETDVDPQGATEPYWDEQMGFYVRMTRGGSHASGSMFDTVWARYPEPEWATSNGVGVRCFRSLD